MLFTGIMKSISPENLIDVSKPDGAKLRGLLREQNISLKPNELTRIAELLGRNPTVVELHIFNTMWSEHCSYKSSKPLLKTLPTKAPHVVLGPGEDAGIIRFYETGGRSYCLVMAHESHNHPSQVLPIEGAATGIGGIVRDVYCMGADVVGVLDPLRFGDPDGDNRKRVRDIVRGVVDGIAQYGNALGVPNYGGDTYFDASYDDNCLVNVVALGVMPEDEIVRSRAPDEARNETYDIILIGKPTDASGFGGAAFASDRLSGDAAEERQEAVQIPDPFLKRVLAEATKRVLAEARAQTVPIGFKDLGAGGISCAISEMAEAGGVGGHIDLDRVNQAFGDFAAQVIACSETQERYAMFVPKHFTDTVIRIYNEDFDLPRLYTGAGAWVIGSTADDLRFRILSRGDLVCDAGVDAITTGIEYDRASKAKPAAPAARSNGAAPAVPEALLEMLASYNIGDKSILFRHYDPEVQGRAVLRPGEADAAVAMFLPGHPVGLAAAVGGNSALAEIDPYLGGAWAVIEAVRNVACVGALPLAVTDCLNYGDPEDPEVFWQFSEGVRGVGDACRGIRVFDDAGQGIPVVSGNVSFYNQSGQGRPIAPTPIVSCAGRIDDASAAAGMGFKKAGNPVVLLGELHDRLGGSEYARHYGIPANGASTDVPQPDFERESARVRLLVDGFGARAIRAAHDISHGGLLIAAAEMILAAAPYDVGCRLDLAAAIGDWAPHALLFSEYGGVVVEIDADRMKAFEKMLDRYGVEHTIVGETCKGAALNVHLPDEIIKLSRADMHAANETNSKLKPLFRP